MATPPPPPKPPWQVPTFVAEDLPRNEEGMRYRKKGFEPGGVFHAQVANFSGGTSVGNQGFSLYGVDGVNPAWVFDGTSVQFIETGRAYTGQIDNPNSLAVLPSQQLALGYADGMLTLSSYGAPAVYEVSSGAAEIAVSDKIVDLATQPNEYLAIFCESSLKLLTGKTATDFSLSTYSENLSLTKYTLQSLGDSVFLTADGITRLNRVQEFGDFRDLSISGKVDPLLHKLNRDVACSWRVPSRNEYWLQYNTGVGVIVKFVGAEVAGISTFDIQTKATCSAVSDDENHERVYIGTEEGFVYQMEQGESFDGDPLPAYFTSVYEYLGSVEHRKRIKKLQMEVQTQESAEFKIRVELDYASPEAPVGYPQDQGVLSGGGFYDLNFFNNVLWSDSEIGLTDTYVQGVGRNVSVAVYSLSDREPPHTLGSMIFHWAARGRRA